MPSPLLWLCQPKAESATMETKLFAAFQPGLVVNSLGVEGVKFQALGPKPQNMWMTPDNLNLPSSVGGLWF